MTGLVHSVCVRVGGGVPKLPLKEARVEAGGIKGDKPRGPRRAVIIYSLERIEGLREEGHPVAAPGSLGENILVEGLREEGHPVAAPGSLGENILVKIGRAHV